jgi:hypothetical protein
MEDIMQQYAVENRQQQLGRGRSGMESRATISRFLGILVTLEAATFLVAAMLHMGLQIPLGFAVLAEPRILPATIVEGTAGILLGVAALGLWERQGWARTTAIVAHVFSICGVLLGIAALAAGRGPRTESNAIFHRVILVVLVAGLFLLLQRATKTALRTNEPAG